MSQAATEGVADGRRKSVRTNKGVPPERFGEGVEETTSKRKTKDDQKSTSARSTRSVRVATARVSLEADERIATLQAELANKEMSLQLLISDLETSKKSLASLEQELSAATEDEDKRRILHEIKDKKCLIETLVGDIATAEIKIATDRKLTEEKIKLVKKRADVELLSIHSESDSDTLGGGSDGELEPEKRSRVENWAEGAANHAERQKQVTWNLEEMSNPLSQVEGTNSQAAENTNSNDLARFVIENAFRMVQSNPNGSSEKLLARQIHGKDLPVFSGKPEDWPQFSMAYESSKQQCQYTDEEDLTRLRRCLKGDAYSCVQGLLTSSKNVASIMAKLKSRYGRPDQIIEVMLKSLRLLPAIRTDKFETIVRFGNEVDNYVYTIKALMADAHLQNPVLVKELEEKLPTHMRLEWAKRKVTMDPNSVSVEHFQKWLSEEAEAAVMLCEYGAKENRRRSPSRKNERIFAANSSKRFRSVRKCCFCHIEGHKNAECPQFSNMKTEDRWKQAREAKVCFGCLNSGHSFKQCRTKKLCEKDGCQKEHHVLLHNIPPATPRVEETVSVARQQGPVNLMILPVRIKGPLGTVSTFAMIDNGSTVTMVDNELAKKVGLKGREGNISISGFQCEPRLFHSSYVNFEIMSNDGNKSYYIKSARTMDGLNLKTQSVRQGVLKKWKHLQSLPIATYTNAQPQILLGSDHPKLMRQLDYRQGKGNSPVAIQTHLGWVLQGRVLWHREHASFHVYSSNDSLHNLVKENFLSENLVVASNVQKPISEENRRAQKILDDTIKKVDGGYEVGLLWKCDSAILPTQESFSMALKRLHSMERKMNKDKDFALQYRSKIKEYIQKGYAKVLTKEEQSMETNRTFYIPHFMHTNPKKPGKFRFVFDAASKAGGKCLNDFLLQGPDKLVNLASVLLKFRLKAIGVCADIKDMFHRVKLKEADQVAQRFLWRLEQDQDPVVMQMQVLIFGATCSPTCAQEVKNQNALQYEKTMPEAVRAILENHYMDDYLDSFDSVEVALKRFGEIRKIHSEGGFNLCNWASSSEEFLDGIDKSLRLSANVNLDIAGSSVERVLGMYWDVSHDCITFSLNHFRCSQDVIDCQRAPTKREVLALTMSVFDPLGFLSVLTIKARILLQELWSDKLGWDDEIPAEKFAKWRSWLQMLQKIPTFAVPRCYSPRLSSAEKIELHVFCDASCEAFGAVAYLRILKHGSIDIAFVTSKAKVAPLKKISIPRLELQAAVIGARLAKFVLKNVGVNVDNVQFWTDSRTVLCWITSESKIYKDFVAYRIGEIQELTNPEQWKWLPTSMNVADEITRFSSVCNWEKNSRWLNGPRFLRQESSSWPPDSKCDNNQVDQSELKKESVYLISRQECIIDFERFSKYTTLIRAMAFVRRFITPKSKRVRGNLTFREMENAAVDCQKLVQNEAFGDICEGTKIPQKSFLTNVQPIRVDGVLRAKGRLQFSSLADKTKFPVILPATHPFTSLLVKHYHEQCGHHGYERIVNEIRQLYYIPKLRSLVRKCRTKCQLCKNRRAAPATPIMGDLPECRVSKTPHPFIRTGMDYFGPIEVVVKRSREKRYGVIFTCLTTRAVHLEVAHSLSTDSCIQAIRRFISRRGCPEDIYSDNGTNMVGANNEIKSALRKLDLTSLQSAMAVKQISWHFIPPAAPHMGGSWERLIKSVKVALGNILHKKTLKDELLLTVFAEAEHSVNSHPLTHVSVDPDDPEAITPNHFLLGRSSNLQHFGKFEKSDMVGKKHWRATQHMANHFWQRWMKEYLPTLLRRDKWNRHSSPIRVGDVTLEVNPNLPRNSWPLAIVHKLYPGKDGVVRVVDIQNHLGHIYKRPVSKLCVLDVISENASSAKE